MHTKQDSLYNEIVSLLFTPTAGRIWKIVLICNYKLKKQQQRKTEHKL